MLSIKSDVCNFVHSDDIRHIRVATGGERHEHIHFVAIIIFEVKNEIVENLEESSLIGDIEAIDNIRHGDFCRDECEMEVGPIGIEEVESWHAGIGDRACVVTAL